jgi:hypothetical protein
MIRLEAKLKYKLELVPALIAKIKPQCTHLQESNTSFLHQIVLLFKIDKKAKILIKMSVRVGSGSDRQN